ncbi:MAG: mechanosensitive ion channel [Sphingomonadaceae bacterium]|nr:mechanosensitive ion channel [Sphingomonadaceae bacterium]
MTQQSAEAGAIDAALPVLSTRASLEGLWADTVAWFNTQGAEISIGLAVGLGIVMLMLLFRRFGERIYNRDPSLANWTSIVGRTMAKTRLWFMVGVGLMMLNVYSAAPVLLATIINFLFTVALVFQIAIWARAIILGIVEHRTVTGSGEDVETLGSAITLIRIAVTVGVFAIAALFVLDNLGFDITGLVAGLGVGGIAIGLAAQGIFEELFAALSIIFDKPFKKGDSVHYDSTWGSVETIGLKTTRIRSVTGEEKIISNSNLLDKEISNNTRLARRRFKFGIGVIYQTPPEAANRIPEILKEIVEGFDHGFVRSGFVGFGNSSIDFELEFDVLNAEYEVGYKGRHDVGMAIFKRFAEEGLEFAYPTQTTFTAAPDGKMIMPYPQGGWSGSE